MEPSSSSTKENDEETRALGYLLECFGSLCTLEEIADAYCIAQHDVIEAGDLLYHLQDRKCNSVSHTQNGLNSYSQGKELVYEDKLEYSTHHDNNLMKPKKLSASFGSVSGAVAKTYGRFSAPRNELNEKTKPPKLKIEEFEESLVDEIDPSISKFVLRNDTFNDKDTRDFLYSMLGEGYQLSEDIIQEVLGNCGYNMKESMNQLLALSAKTLDNKGKEVDSNVPKKPSQMETCDSEQSYPNSSSAIRMDSKSANLPNEVLQSLFSFPERSEEEEPKLKRTESKLNRTEVVGQVEVAEALDDTTFSPSPYYTSKTELVDHDEVDNYRIYRNAAREHWDAMKTYYEAAIDAFTNGDKERASYLLEQGKHHTEMAREANEKSAKEIVEPRGNNQKEVIDLDLRAHDAKDALDILKIHLRSLASIPTFSCLKLILGHETEDSKSRRKRRKVIKLLERESIEWSEASDAPGTICIQLEDVDPEELSFRKSQSEF